MKSLLMLFMFSLAAMLAAQTVTSATGLAAEDGKLKTSASVRVLFSDDFMTEKENHWKFFIYQNRLKVERKIHEGRQALVITNGIGKKIDTAFDLIIQPLEVAELKQYSIEFSSSANFATEGCSGRKLSNQNRILFLDENQKLIKVEHFRYSSIKKGYKENVISGSAPAGTKYISVVFGADTPDIRPGHYIAIADLKISVVDTLRSWSGNNGAKVVLQDDFKKDTGLWKIEKNYKNALKIGRSVLNGRSALLISNALDKNVDTAFIITSQKIPVNQAEEYHISFDLHANFRTADYGKNGRGIRSYTGFYDTEGKLIESHPVKYDGLTKTFNTYSCTGKIPAGAATFALVFGGDSPDVKSGNFIAISNIKIQIADAGRKGSFISGIFPIKDSEISWKLSGKNALARFQIATAGDLKKSADPFSAFAGPDGSPASFYTESGGKLNLPAEAKWIRYKATLIGGSDPAVLEQVRIAGNTDHNWKSVLDTVPPRFLLTSSSPVEDGSKPLRIEIQDDSSVNWFTLQVRLDDKMFNGRIVPQKNCFELYPEKAFSAGVHKVQVSAFDLNGNRGESFLFFRIGKVPEKGYVTLRNDGMTLVDGKPFFPIGIYNVQKLPLNKNSYDIAFSNLKEAGINFVQTYSVRRDANYAEFMKSAGKYGMKVWIAGEGSSNDVDLCRIAKSLTEDLENPLLLAWYIGDDTAAHNTAGQLEERTALVKSLAPHLITVQADSMDVTKGSRYRDFVQTTLAFMPEIYAIKKGDQANAASCVAEVMRDVDQCFKDIQERGLAPRSIWPIIQYFKGWHTYKRFPTPLEFRAMCFAALVRGAHGIIFYTYNSRGENQGVSANENIWNTFSAVTKEIASYLPVLQEMTPEEKILPEIISGPAKNLLGGESIAVLKKYYQGKTYLFCVNATIDPVIVRLKIQPNAKKIQLLSHPDQLTWAPGKDLIEKFSPYDVRIYLIE